MYILTTPEPRPVFIDLEFDSSNGLTSGEAFEEICGLHSAIHERLRDRTALQEWGELYPIALLNLHDNNDLTAKTVVVWPEEEALDSLTALLNDHWPKYHWNVSYEIVGPGHDSWKSHAAEFWDHDCQFSHDESWRTD